MILEYTVSIGSIAQTVILASTFLTFLYTMRGDINLVKQDIRYLQDSQKALTEAFTQLGKILTQVAVQDTRINMNERRIDELAHGRGYVKTKERDHGAV